MQNANLKMKNDNVKVLRVLPSLGRRAREYSFTHSSLGKIKNYGAKRHTKILHFDF
jgi:hypothetical protein